MSGQGGLEARSPTDGRPRTPVQAVDTGTQAPMSAWIQDGMPGADAACSMQRISIEALNAQHG